MADTYYGSNTMTLAKARIAELRESDPELRDLPNRRFAVRNNPGPGYRLLAEIPTRTGNMGLYLKPPKDSE